MKFSTRGFAVWGLVLTAAARAPASITIEPPQPTAADTVRITASGELPDPCFDVTASVMITGRRITIAVAITPQLVPCVQVLWFWQVVREVGPLAPGDYDVVVQADAESETAHFRVGGVADELPVAVCTGDCDGDGAVTIDELTFGVDVVLGRVPDGFRCPLLQPASISGLVQAVGYALSGCPPPTVADFSGFDRFELLRGESFGYCPILGSVQAAIIQRMADGSYTLKRSVVEAGTTGVDHCLLPSFVYDCVVSHVEPCRTLTLDETQRVGAVFAAVTVLPGPTPYCGFEDSCLVTTARWDQTQLGDHSCNERRFDYPELKRLIAMLDGLGAGPERPCPSGLCGHGTFRLCNDGNDVGGDGCAADCSEEIPGGDRLR